jgi:hypothetical protein
MQDQAELERLLGASSGSGALSRILLTKGESEAMRYFLTEHRIIVGYWHFELPPGALLLNLHRLRAA